MSFQYDSKQSDNEASLMLELVECGYPSLPWLPSSLWPIVIAPDGFLSMGQIQLLDI